MCIYVYMHHTPVCQAKSPAQKSAPHMRRVAPAAQTTAAPPPNRAVSFFYLSCVCTHRERVLGAVSCCFIFLGVFFVCVHTHTQVYMVHDCVRLRARVCVRACECENIYSCTTLSLCIFNSTQKMCVFPNAFQLYTHHPTCHV